MNRKVVGIAVVALWSVGLGLLYKRNGKHSPQQSLAEAGMRVSPETYYYMLQQSGTQVGAASSSVDTTKQRIVAVDFVRGTIPIAGKVVKLEARSEARFTRGMRLRDFVVRAVGDFTPFMIRGVMQDQDTDKTLRITSMDGKRKPVTQESVPQQPVFVPTVAPIPLMLKGEPKIGDSIAVAVFNPLSRSVHAAMLRIQADSLFLVPDSAAFDSTSGRWVKAHQSSIRGWRIGSDAPGLTVWVDIAGRLLAAAEPSGISVSRTTFELSFSNWTLDHSPSADSARAKSVAASTRSKTPPAKN